MRVVCIAVLAACHVNDSWVPPDAHMHDGANKPVDAAVGHHDAHPDASVADAYVEPAGLLPTAPGAGAFMWPSVQEAFHRSDGSTCHGRVTVALGDRAVCYVGVDDDVHCAGAVYTQTFGSTFVAIGRPGVDQITFTPTANSATGNAMCVHELAGTQHCMGNYNWFGAFADGTTSPTATFALWQSPMPVARIGSSFDTRCILDTAGEVYCAGYNIGMTPVREDSGGGHTSFWMNDFGQLAIDDATTFRAANGSPCWIQSDGMHCHAPDAQPLSGVAGEVVDGGISQPPGGLAMGSLITCWLDSHGRVFCGVSNIVEQRYTAAPPIVAFATNFYADARCAVGNDGSLWCSGTNMHGELGTGTTTPLMVDTQVQPPGSVKIICT